MSDGYDKERPYRLRFASGEVATVMLSKAMLVELARRANAGATFATFGDCSQMVNLAQVESLFPDG